MYSSKLLRDFHEDVICDLLKGFLHQPLAHQVLRASEQGVQTASIPRFVTPADASLAACIAGLGQASSRQVDV